MPSLTKGAFCAVGCHHPGLPAQSTFLPSFAELRVSDGPCCCVCCHLPYRRREPAFFSRRGNLLDDMGIAWEALTVFLVPSRLADWFSVPYCQSACCSHFPDGESGFDKGLGGSLACS